jgi:hypothetical protein
MRRRSNRIHVTVSTEMTIALDILAAKSGLSLATQAMVVLRQGLDRTIQSDAAQLRIKQEAAFRTRDQWLQDTMTERFVENALAAAEYIEDGAPTR